MRPLPGAGRARRVTAETPARVIAREGANRLGAAFVAGFPGALGLLCAVAGLERMVSGTPDGDDVALVVLGSAMAFCGWRLWRFTTGVRMAVDGDSLWVSRFLGGRRYRFSAIEALGVYGRIVKPNARGGPGRLPMNLRLPVLVVATARGSVHEHTLPGSGSKAILDALGERMSIPIETLPDGEKRPPDFGQRLR